MRDNDSSKPYRLFNNLTPIEEDVPPGFDSVNDDEEYQQWDSTQVQGFSMSYTAYEPNDEGSPDRIRSNSLSIDDSFALRSFLIDKGRSSSFSFTRQQQTPYTYVPNNTQKNGERGTAPTVSDDSYSRGFIENKDFRRSSSFSLNRQDMDFSITTYRTEDGTYNSNSSFLMPDNERHRSNSFTGQNAPYYDNERNQSPPYSRSNSFNGQNPPYMTSSEERHRSSSFSVQNTPYTRSNSYTGQSPPYNRSSSYTGQNSPQMTSSEERYRSNSISGQSSYRTSSEERNRSSSFSSQSAYYTTDNSKESRDNSTTYSPYQYEHQRRFTSPDVRELPEFRIYNPPSQTIFKSTNYTTQKKNNYGKSNDTPYPQYGPSVQQQRRYTAPDIYSSEVSRTEQPQYEEARKFKQRKPHSAYKGKRGRNRSQKDDPEMYEINLDAIITGEDKRSTLMIQNIPNKYDQELLLETLDESFSGTYDFFYLPMDFMNQCNVGYAFINFISESTIPDFYRDFNMKSWPRFKSYKICQLTYGRIQGKEGLIEHFKNSRLMREYPRYRPAVFYSDGDMIGQRQEFPVFTEN